jgi:hypothetical protein
MAPRNKPKGKDVSAWLGGNRGTVQSGSSNETQIDTGGGERDKVNETLMLGVAGAAGVTAAAVGLRATGLPQRLANTLKGKTVGLHGSPVPGLKSIDPRISRSDVETGIPTVSFMRTDVPPQMRASNVGVNQQYAGSQGSIYVVKATKATSDLPKFSKPAKLPKFTQSADRVRPVIKFDPPVATKTTTSAKVFAEIPVNKYPTEDLLRAEVARQTRLAGSSMRTQSVRNKIKGLTPKKKSSRLNPDVS